MAASLLRLFLMEREQREWVAALARLGFAVKGVLYLLVGGLALRFALGDGGRLTDPHGLIGPLLAAPYGRPLVGSLAVGLAMYAAWRFIEAFADANHRGSDPRGLASRAIYALSGIIYSVLAWDAAALAFARDGGAGGTELPPTILGSELARWAALLIAAALIGYGILQLRRAMSSQLSEQLSPGRVRRQAGEWAVNISRAGMAGRAVVLMVMGFVIGRRALVSADSAAQTDTGDSLRLIATLPTGDWLLALIALGLMSYGVFQLIHARFRTISPP